MRPNYDSLCSGVREFQERLDQIKKEEVSIRWYRYSILSNIFHIGNILPPEFDHLLAPSKTFADIGAADGDLAFYLQHKGYNVHTYDFSQIKLQAQYYLKTKLNSSVQIFQSDLDSQFRMDFRYETVFFLGILYHLKNPFYVLEQLSKCSLYMFLSTRTIRTFAAGFHDVSQFSAGYLLDAPESNNDATNYWLFTEVCLVRLLERSGWEIIAKKSGEVDASNPHDRDERIFLLAKSTRTTRAISN